MHTMTDERSIIEELAGRFRADLETISKTLASYCGLTRSKAVQELDLAGSPIEDNHDLCARLPPVLITGWGLYQFAPTYPADQQRQ